MTDLSSAAQAVVTAIEKFDWEAGHFSREDIWMNSREVTAAALRAAAEHAKRAGHQAAPSSEWDLGYRAGIRDTAQGLFAIAAELDGTNPSESD